MKNKQSNARRHVTPQSAPQPFLLEHIFSLGTAQYLRNRAM